MAKSKKENIRYKVESIVLKDNEVDTTLLKNYASNSLNQKLMLNLSSKIKNHLSILVINTIESDGKPLVKIGVETIFLVDNLDHYIELSDDKEVVSVKNRDFVYLLTDNAIAHLRSLQATTINDSRLVIPMIRSRNILSNKMKVHS